MGSGVLLVDPAGRPLIVEPTYKDTWEIPGGVVESGEDPRRCAVREVEEELLLNVDLGRLLVIDWKQEPPPHGDAIMLIYDGGELVDTSRLRLQESELRSVEFVEESMLDTRLSRGLANRVRYALEARRLGKFVELVNGLAVPY
jgi:ADP-ribose pyrophosphatase YjhB (NUDIX family)